MGKVAEQGSTKIGRFIKGLRIQRTEKTSKQVEDIESHVSQCQRKKLQIFEGKKEKLE